MRPDGSPSGIREALAGDWREVAVYVAAAAIYVGIGVAVPEFLFSWVVATGYLLLTVVVLPALVHVFRG